MTFKSWVRTPRIRRGLAAATVVLAAGGLVLFRADARTASPYPAFPTAGTALPAGSNTTSFAGPGVHGTFGLSHTSVLAGGSRQLFADVTLVADPGSGSHESAPLAMAIALDTSGSMSGEKIAQARSAITRLLRDMKDNDDVALVRYSDSAELVQPLARVGAVREGLIARVNALEAAGGTAIPLGLSKALDALSGEHGGRVRRIVLVSDGLDSSRPESERLASSSFERGITTSSMGIGLDFDEAYMGGLARSGHGNFGFVNDGPALASFLQRELMETAGTTVEAASVRIALPEGVRFVRATGADARVDGASVELKVGSMFAGEERRVLLELSANMSDGVTGAVSGLASWQRVGAGAGTANIPGLSLVAVRDPSEVERSRDGKVLARAVSVTASERQLEAAQAWSQGDKGRADALIQQNLDELRAVRAIAPAPMASSLAAQSGSYESTRKAFDSVAPTSTAGKIHAKAAAAKNFANSTGTSF